MSKQHQTPYKCSSQGREELRLRHHVICSAILPPAHCNKWSSHITNLTNSLPPDWSGKPLVALRQPGGGTYEQGPPRGPRTLRILVGSVLESISHNFG
jgi:hypothetical protein